MGVEARTMASGRNGGRALQQRWSAISPVFLALATWWKRPVRVAWGIEGIAAAYARQGGFEDCGTTHWRAAH